MSEAYESNYHIAQGENVQGPYTRTQVLQLIDEGQVRADMLFSRDGADWVEGSACSELFPDERPAAPIRGGAQNPGLHRAGSRGRGRLEPHRGGAILVLGILGVVFCQICSIIAWVMGNTDMAKIRAGRMDPSGEGLTQAGRILGIVGTVLLLIGILLVVLYMGASVRSPSGY
jgi:hypothetical protein